MDAHEFLLALFVVILPEECGDNPPSNVTKNKTISKQTLNAQAVEVGIPFTMGGMWTGKEFLLN